MHVTIDRTLSTVLTASVVVFSSGVNAQEEVPIDEIRVTARLVEESLQDIPVSVAAFTSQTIEERGLEDLTEIARSTPGFSFENFNGAFATPVIRGQSQNRLTNPVQNVATFYNGIYIQRGYMVDASLLNIGQVEVLRGPQAAAFGRNAYAGAVNFKSKSIGDEYTAFVSASVGEDEYQRYDITAELPFNEYIGAILGYSHGEYDGAWENNHALADISDPLAKTTGNLGGFEYDTFNVGLTISPTDNFYIKANYIQSDRDVENVPQYTLAGSPLYSSNQLNCSPVGFGGGNALFCGEIPTDVPLAAGENRTEGLVVDPRTGLRLESEVVSLEFDYAFTDTLSLNVLYGTTEGTFSGAGSSARNQETGFDGPFATPPIFLDRLLIDTSGNGSIESDSFEGRLTWIASDSMTGYLGGYFSESDDLTNFALLSVPAQTTGPLDPGFELNFPGFAADSLNAREISSVFAFFNYEVGDWAYSIEGRYTNEEISETDNVSATSASEDYSYFTPRVTASYFINESQSVYASFAQGVKAGGFNTGGSNPANFADPSQATFDEETNNTFEIGSRNILMDGRLTLNATLFYIDAEDLQVNVPQVGVLGNVIGNRAEATTLGFEVEAVMDVTDNFQLYGGIGYANAEYGDVIDLADAARCDDIVCSSTGDISGNRLERTPELTLNVGFNLDGQLTAQTGYFVRGSAGYQDMQFSNAINTAELPGRTIVDGSVGVSRGGFEARLAADNLFDEEYAASAFEVGFLSTYIPNLGNRRRVSLQLSYRY